MMADLKPYSRMKDSGVEWLGEVPKHWNVVALCTVGRPKSIIGHIQRQLLSVYLNLGVIAFSDVQEKRTNVTSEDLSRYQAVDPGDLVLNNQQAWRGSVGVSQLAGIISPAYLILSLDNQYDLRYANLLFRDRSMVIQYLLSSRGVGTIQRNLYWPHLRRMTTLLPPPNEQTAIVRYLDHIDRRVRRLIRAKRKLIALLTEQKQAIIHRAVTRGLDPDLPLKDSGVEWLGKVPEHWEVRRNGQLFSQRKETGHPDLPILEVSLRTGVRIRDFDSSNRKQVMSDREMYKRAVKGDIAYNMMRMWQGAIGVAAVDGLVSPAYVVARPLPGTNVYYFEKLFRTSAYMQGIDYSSRGIVKDRNRLYWEDFKAMPACLPPPEEQAAIVDYLDKTTSDIDTAITRTAREIDLLNEYRIRLIADVVTGKLDVREVAAALPEVDPLAADDEPDDALETDSGADPDDPDSIPEEVEA